MKILLLGRNGQVGWELQRTLQPVGEVHAFGSGELDITNSSLLVQTIKHLKPEVIINAAAYTDVDRAESEPDLAMQVNGTAPGVMAETARLVDAVLIHYSTDYVFDGRKGSPYTEEDAPKPISVYGKTKLAGEQAVKAVDGAHLIMRTSWVYSLRGDNFVTKVLQWARRQETLRIADDQIANPTWARELAEITTQVLIREAALSSSKRKSHIREHSGLYHLAGTGYASRFEWARMILELDPNRREQIAKKILPVPTSDFPAPAQRPLFSALDCEKFFDLFSLRLAPWMETLRMACLR